MTATVKKMRLGDVILHRRGSFALWLIHFIFGVAISIFFRKIELYNAENLPVESGIIFVSNHPNALIDPALLFVALPRNIAFLAKSTLFKMPLIGYLVRTVGALPLYRQQDEGADVSKNQKTFNIARELLKKGGAIAIFPEGVSHDKPQLQPLKTGAARIALGAVSVGRNPGSFDLQIVPVGLYYTNKTTFRSEVVLHFGAPFRVAPVALDEHGQPPHEAVKKLTAAVEQSLRAVTVNAADEAEMTAARIAEEVFATTAETPNAAERLAFLRQFVAEPPTVSDEKLEKRLAEYDKKLDELGIESEFLSLAEYSRRFVLQHALRRSWHLLLLAPLALIGVALHFPAYQICRFLAYLQTKKGELDMASTVKVLAGVVLMPLTWLTAAAISYFYAGWKIAALTVPAAFLCGYVALRTLEEIEELRGWSKAIVIFFSRREKFLRLLAEKRRLFEKVKSEK